jgi:hypothetical protein
MHSTILVKSGKDAGWSVPTTRPYTNEDHLRTLLQGAPELLPGIDASRPVVLVHELEVQYGFIDLAGVSPTGAITVVECKLRGNPDMRRTIVGQLFAYAAGLWAMSYEAFDSAWQALTQPFNMTTEAWEARKRPPLIEEMAAAVEEHDLEWDRDAFAKAVEDNLAAGRFTLVFAVDVITPELRRIVEYLAEHTAPEVNVIALEIDYLADGDTEVLVPQPYGQEMAQRKVAGTGAHGAPIAPDEASFMNVLRATQGEWAEPMMRAVLAWADESGLEVWYGAGSKQGSLHVGKRDATGARRSLMTGGTSADLLVEFNGLAYWPALDAHEARVEVMRRLEAVEGGRVRPEQQADSWPSFRLHHLRPAGALDRFLGVMTDVVERIREA